MKRLLLIALASIFLLLAACATGSDDPAEAYKDYSAEKLYTSSQTALANRNYREAVRYLEGMQTLYPYGPYAKRTKRDIIFAYYKKGDYASAEAAASAYIRLYPDDSDTSYAYYMKGMSLVEQKRTFLQRVLPIDMARRDLELQKQAFYAFRDLTQQFPNSRYAPSAKQHMIDLRDMFARHELQVGDFYFKRHVYVGSANRASYIIQHLQGTPSVEPALVMLIKSNRAMNLNKAADDALHVLQTNFPHSRSLAQLERNGTKGMMGGETNHS